MTRASFDAYVVALVAEAELPQRRTDEIARIERETRSEAARLDRQRRDVVEHWTSLQNETELAARSLSKLSREMGVRATTGTASDTIPAQRIPAVIEDCRRETGKIEQSWQWLQHQRRQSRPPAPQQVPVRPVPQPTQPPPPSVAPEPGGVKVPPVLLVAGVVVVFLVLLLLILL
ncbi:hypothetical protein RCF27_06995 [Rhodococcus pyridinivorans]|uniref:Uncharacterized protein n=1 Tax=Rhodococcus pyridinivorans TaxID=103816 RepID=A0A7M2XQL9_9NOCA|nr:hypothetical protein [Rhodococcus pyridinivorans]QOW00145.1 hypothetical protein INP59_07285 [Rhodococcus pyridinivorans]WMM74042.1 hypothetical protein RCF27_06995 [Rhodococcus pyridinivorans]